MYSGFFRALCLCCFALVSGSGAAGEPGGAIVSTFSIVAYDPQTGDYGVAVQSRYFSVGDVVPHASAGTGAVATQARGNLRYGFEGLELLAQGMPAGEVISTLTGADPLSAERQLGVVDRKGVPATFTGADCLPWAGGLTGEHYAVQGNLLAGPQVVAAMAAAYEVAPGDLAERLVYALAAGQAAGGDARGRQSAAVLVVRARGGYMGLTDRYVDLHVEDHETPIRELRRLLQIRYADLAVGKATEAFDASAAAEGDDRVKLLDQARDRAREAVSLDPEDDGAWWLLARIELAAGEREAAAAAGRRALLENPSWRRLPPHTTAVLGVEPSFIEALTGIESFRRLWDSLAPPDEAPPPGP
ncbi:MAG: DUF1028 domain-containing protein [Gammaproteobacteria bacterium]